MAHDHIIYDSDPHFSIDVDTRAISYVSPEKLVVVQGDHNSEIFTFDMPRYADGHDMLECDIRQIHYINLDGERGILKSIGVYPIADMKESEEDSNKVVFSWTIAQNATKYVGTLSFAIRFACSGENSTLDYVWRTLPYSSVPVSKSIDNVEEFVEDYTDVLQEWYDTLMSSGQEGVNMVEAAKQQAITNIEDSRKQAIASVEYALASVGGIIVSITAPTTEKAVAWLNPETSVLRIKDNNGDWKSLDSIKGDPGSLDNVVQEFGYDEELVISQKVITEKVEQLQSGIDANGNSLGDVDRRLANHEERISNLESDVLDGNLRERISSLESDVIDGNHEERIAALESKDDEIEDTLSSHQTHISSLSDAMVDRTTRIRALEAKDTDLQTQITELQTNKVRIASGNYVGDGESVAFSIKRLEFGFKALYIIVKDDSGNWEDYTFICDPNADTSIIYDERPSSMSSVWIKSARTPKVKINETTGELSTAYSGMSPDNPYKVAPFWYWIDNKGISWSGNMEGETLFNEEGVTYTWIAIGLEV